MAENNEINMSPEVLAAMQRAMARVADFRHEYLTPEHLLWAFLQDEKFTNSVKKHCWIDDNTFNELVTTIDDYLSDFPSLPTENPRMELSHQFNSLVVESFAEASAQGRDSINVCDVMYCMTSLNESVAAVSLLRCLEECDCPLFEMLDGLAEAYEVSWVDHDLGNILFDELPGDDKPAEPAPTDAKPSWMKYARPVAAQLEGRHPLIGRNEELERMMQVLCRKQKNSPLLLGESGVGKTSMVYGLAARIKKGDVPERLKGCEIYRLDMASLLAGAQFKGDFEDRLTKLLEGIAASDRNILFIDEMHEIVGKGGGDSGLDASGVLLPFLDNGRVRVIGATTYADYNRFMASKNGLVRRCQTIDVPELSSDETIKILGMLKPIYEQFHGVTYDDDALDFAVRMSTRHLQDRYQPDKSIDLIDEAGAYVQLHGIEDKRVTKDIVATVLARMAHVDALSVNDDDTARLESLKSRITNKIYGQDDAVNAVVEAVQMAKAGLTDEDKPLASLLFVGPTGVGKTEVARVLSKELGVQLVRFDMSEYAEKHTVAKFIGSPAGYVGYDDGGQLTDAVRKNPDCVLLFDEIEKAHSDIFDVLLQVMDYGVLTDNKGRKTHFQNVVIIMTSNAGAQFARQASVGFASSVTTGDAMLAQVKRTFKPEFINRLSGIVVFRDMDHDMASLILDKKLGELSQRLSSRNVTLKVSAKAHERLLKLGYSQEYGAREMDRVINQHVKALLMHEILFGELKNGGKATLKVSGDEGFAIQATGSDGV